MGSTLKTLSGIGVAATFLVAATISFVQDHEGLRTKAYKDPVGIPTICFGETLGVALGDRRTVAECHEMLSPRLLGFLAQMRACTNVALPAKTEAAMLSFTYNLGSGIYCQNMAVRRINRGLLREACNALQLYTRAGGRVLPGLVRRRQEEHVLCVQGLDEAGLP